MKCSCGKLQNIKILCLHAIRICDALNIDLTTYIHPCCNLEYVLNTYSHAFAVPRSESLWRDPMGPKWLPNPKLLQAKVRPVKSRIRNDMDGVKNNNLNFYCIMRQWLCNALNKAADENSLPH